MTDYYWRHDSYSPRQHWLYLDNVPVGLVYEVNPTSFSVYGEDFGRNAFARMFLGVMPTLDEAKDMLVTLTHSRIGETA